MNFDNFLFHCHSLGLLMTEPREKSNLEKYNEAVSKRAALIPKFEKLELDIAEIKNQETKTFSKKMDTLERYEKRIDVLGDSIKQLEPIKDVKELSETCKAHLMDLFVANRYGVTRDIKLKYWEKGLLNEENAIDIYTIATNTMFEKNKVRKSNGYVTGEIDFPSDIMLLIYDTKVSWNIFTFWRSLAKGVTDLEYWQAQAYMWLWEMDKAKVCKILTDTPDKLIENEKKDLLRDFIGTPEQYEEACVEIEKLHKYKHIPFEERIIELEVERSDEDIEKIPERLEMCRDFLNNIKPGSYYEVARQKQLSS